MKKRTIRLNESELRKVISECVKRVLNEKYGDSNWFMNHERDYDETLNSRIDDDTYASTEKVAEEFFNDNVLDGEELSKNEVKIEVKDSDSRRIYVNVYRDNWQFWFPATAERVDETDLCCRVYGGALIEYISPDGEEGSWEEPSPYGFIIVVKDYFDYSNVTSDPDDV